MASAKRLGMALMRCTVEGRLDIWTTAVPIERHWRKPQSFSSLGLIQGSELTCIVISNFLGRKPLGCASRPFMLAHPCARPNHAVGTATLSTFESRGHCLSGKLGSLLHSAFFCCSQPLDTQERQSKMTVNRATLRSCVAEKEKRCQALCPIIFWAGITSKIQARRPGGRQSLSAAALSDDHLPASMS